MTVEKSIISKLHFNEHIQELKERRRDSLSHMNIIEQLILELEYKKIQRMYQNVIFPFSEVLYKFYI